MKNMGLFRILLIFFLIYLVIKMLGRMLFPSGGHDAARDNVEPREGDVEVENGNPGKKKRFRKDIGEYVDYEEVE